MGQSATNINIIKNYRGRIYIFISVDSGCLTFFGPYKGNQVRTQTWTSHSEITVQYFWKPVKVQEDDQGLIELYVAPKYQHFTKHITIKYHHFHIFIAKVEVRIDHTNLKEQVADFLQNLWVPNCFAVYISILMPGVKTVSLFIR